MQKNQTNLRVSSLDPLAWQQDRTSEQKTQYPVAIAHFIELRKMTW
jgi:hypothetical protein